MYKVLVVSASSGKESPESLKYIDKISTVSDVQVQYMPYLDNKEGLPVVYN